ncbi:MAG: hypothetical protein H0V84_00720 [Actinobacteria bacterium]|nr:hypothetical protein [Actinomycetota bacterium]
MRVRRPVLALLCALGTGCGGAGPAPEFAPGDASTAPPPFVLRSSAGTQTASQGSSCVDSGQGGGMFGSVCADTAPPPAARLSVVRPGETVRIAMAGARLSAAEASVHPLGCPGRLLRRIRLGGRETRWRVTLPPGDYELSLFGRFHADDGRQGDSSGVAGLSVSAEAALEIVDAAAGVRKPCA